MPPTANEIIKFVKKCVKKKLQPLIKFYHRLGNDLETEEDSIIANV